VRLVDERPATVALGAKEANIRYHDAAARSYDAKWAISFDERCIAYVRERAGRMLPKRLYDRVLEIGSGTGFFLLNLWQAGFVGEAHATDISPGMLRACLESARVIGCDLRARTADAEALPYEEGIFDLVVGHAFLHHVPDVERALAEAHRVLAPGGALFVAGEPSRVGDRLARRVGRLTGQAFRVAAAAAPRLRKVPADRPESEDERILRDLEWHVDLHTFEPEDLRRAAERAGFADVRVETEELLSSVVGWAVRTIEAEAPAGMLGERWARFAYRTYLRLYALDSRVLYRVLPERVFYNVLLYGEKRG
jgi:ubiquinone/menaquinone biosynthesis C-methylase UbiE